MRCDETCWIPLSDGTRLAARIWRPDGEGANPAVLEYLPYRRRDRHRGDDAVLHPALAAAGYAAIRVDLRGSGDSDGLMHDEYTEQEWRDGLEVIAWIAAQPWCDGAVGMMGLSWSGFNALQHAALAPPALKAIVTTCASDDRYNDDMHYMGGCLLGDNLQYGATLFTWLATPPDPRIVGSRWREMWRQRLEAVTPPALRWMRHPMRDGYWRSGSVCEDYGAIRVPVLAVGGWADGYTNAVMRLLSGLGGPRKGLIGPWGHAYPHVAVPGPAIDFLAYLVRWWDHWLRGRDTGLMDEPMLTHWLQESEAPRPSYPRRAGRWVGQRVWPPAAAPRLRLAGSGAGLVPVAAGAGPATPAPMEPRLLSSAPDTGTDSGEWCPYGWGPDMPPDQAREDGASVCLDSAALEEALALVGGPELVMTLEPDSPDAIVAVRLNEVSPDGVSRRLSYGLVNLALGDDHSAARAPGAGGAVTVRLKLNDLAHEVPAGHRLRLAFSTACWPLAVGVPRRPRLRLLGAEVTLPLLDPANLAPPAELGVARVPPYPEARALVAPERGRLSVERRMDREETVVSVVRNLGAVELGDVELTLRALGSERYAMPWHCPEDSVAETERLAEFTRSDWHARVHTRTRLGFSGGDFRFEAEIIATEGSVEVFRRRWDETVSRPGRHSGAAAGDDSREE